ncbi:MAG: NAD(P)/FAD-dependent oxidoreductase [Nitrospirae bacterium]|nr:NAD(P)/FAD-dependent oxidoreductase [Nitrospirota bacterium]
MSGSEDTVYDCIIIGAGPGGLQAAVYLGRYNRQVLLIDRGGGRTSHALHIENFLTRKEISGRELIELGLAQARTFHVRLERGLVTGLRKFQFFEVLAGGKRYLSKFVIVSSGVYDNLPEIENVREFLGRGFYTCVDCDGYRTTGRKLLVMGNSINTVHLAFAMKEMFTEDLTLLLIFYDPPEEYKEALREEGITLVKGRPVRIIGSSDIEAVEMRDGGRIPCEAIMSNFGFKLNDRFLSGLQLKRDPAGFKYVVNHHYESSLGGLYIVGPLNTGPDQAVIAAGEGAVAALDIKKRLLEL